jgi:hypothetical protein
MYEKEFIRIIQIFLWEQRCVCAIVFDILLVESTLLENKCKTNQYLNALYEWIVL